MSKITKIDVGDWRPGTCVERIQNSVAPRAKEFGEMLAFVKEKQAEHNAFFEEKSDEIYFKSALERLHIEAENGLASKATMDKIQRLTISGPALSRLAIVECANRASVVWQAVFDLAAVALTVVAFEHADDLANERLVFNAIGVTPQQTELTRRWEVLRDKIEGAITYAHCPAGEAIQRSVNPNPGQNILEAIGV